MVAASVGGAGPQTNKFKKLLEVKMKKAEIKLIETPDGTRYVLVYDSRPRHEFSTVTEAQIFCINNKIPFVQWV